MSRRRRFVAALTAVLMVLTVRQGQALADFADNQATADNDTVFVGHVQGGSGGGGGSGSGPVYRDCVTVTLALSTFMTGFDQWSGNTTNITTTASALTWQTCYRTDSGAEVGWVTGLGTAGDEVDPTAALVDQARSTIVIDVPDVQLSPPEGGTQLVGLPIWVWSTNHHPVSTTASIPTLSATLTATPGNIGVDLGDGTKFACHRGGTPYKPDLPHQQQRSTCAKAYERHGPRTLTVTVIWTLTWTATNGQTGTLPAITRTTAIDLNIQQAQAVTD